MKARLYQEEAVRSAVEDGIIALPTGTGKTVVAAQLVKERGGRCLFLVHRDELARQAIDKFGQVAPLLKLGVVKAERDEVDADVVVASVQTLARGERLSRVLQVQPGFNTIIVDEAHHSAADSYRRVLDALPGVLKIGITATPFRSDEKSIGEVFPKILYRKTLFEMIKAGWLCDLRGKQVRLEGLDLSGVQQRAGDYQDGALGFAMEEANAPARVVEGWLKWGVGLKTLCFLPTVATAQLTCDLFNQAGVKAGFVFGDMDLELRRQVLDRFRSGFYKVLVNCAVLLEGYDEPSIECVAVARPTRSRVLYTQMVGRGTRRFPGKDGCLVLDYTGGIDSTGVETLASLFGITEKTVESGIMALMSSVVAPEQRPIGDLDAIDREFAQHNLVLAWIKDGDRRYLLPLGDETLEMKPCNDPGGWSIRSLPKQGAGSRLLYKAIEFGYAQGICEDLARASSGWALANAGAKWRKDGASDAQKKWIMKWGLWRDGMSKGEASEIMTREFARRRR